MQTVCPTEVVRDRQMKRKRNGRMREMIVPRMTGLEEKNRLPHTRDPEFATPKSQEKKQIYRGGQRKTVKEKEKNRKDS